MTGASGGCASSLWAVLKSHGNQVIGTDLICFNDKVVRMDICDHTHIHRILDHFQPEMIIHLAAKTDVDSCETHPDDAYRINHLGTKNVALECQRLNIPLVYLSTMEVFDGEKETPYTESDTPHPINVYGKSKYEGEKTVQSLLKNYYIVRTAWLISGGKNDKKFVGKIIKILETEKEIKVVSDKIGSPTFAKDLSYNLLKLIETKKYGLYHMCNKGFCSRYEMAQKIISVLGRNDVKLIPVSSDQFKLPAPRGHSEASINQKLKLLGLDLMPSWESSLENYLKTEFKN